MCIPRNKHIWSMDVDEATEILSSLTWWMADPTEHLILVVMDKKTIITIKVNSPYVIIFPGSSSCSTTPEHFNYNVIALLLPFDLTTEVYFNRSNINLLSTIDRA